MRLTVSFPTDHSVDSRAGCSDPGATYGVTMFSDLSEAEFESMYVAGRQHWNISLAEREARGETGVSHHMRGNYTYRRQLSGGTVDWRYHMGGRVSVHC